MKEIGGYIELDNYNLPMLHENAIALNTGRNCLGYLIKTKNIKTIYLPYYLCESVINLCKKFDLKVCLYHINNIISPKNLEIDDNAFLYVVNYYGQLSNNKIIELKKKYKNIIIDNAQAYFQMPVDDVDTIYTCRKFFGVSDGAFLYTNVQLNERLEIDESYKRMNFLLGRYERTAAEFYSEYVNNNKSFANEPLKRMSKLTNNLLHGINYKEVKIKRTKNYNYLYDRLEKINKLNLKRIEGAFAYPLYIENGKAVRKKLIEQKIYVPTLWPNVINDELKGEIEYDMSLNILPLPCDQRYDEFDMEYVLNKLEGLCYEFSR